MNRNEAARIIDYLMNHYGLMRAGWGWVWSPAMNVLGLCQYSTKTLKFSQYWTARTSRDEFTDTVVHEIAHALTPGHGHDSVWMAKAQALGGTGRVRYDHEPLPIDYPWQGVCEGGHRTWSEGKPADIERSMCEACFKASGQYVPWRWAHRGVPYTTTASGMGRVLSPEQALQIFQERATSPEASAQRLNRRKVSANG